MIEAWDAQSSPTQAIETGVRTGSTPNGWTNSEVPYSETDDGTSGFEFALSDSVPASSGTWAAARAAYAGNAAGVEVHWSSGDWQWNYGSYGVTNGLNGARVNRAFGEVYDDPNVSTAAWMGQGGNSPNGIDLVSYYQPASVNGKYNINAWYTWGEFTAQCADPGYWDYEVNGTDEWRNGGWPPSPPGP